MPTERGFSLTEVLSGTAILALLTSFALPNMHDKHRDADASAIASDLHRAVQHARSNAQQRARELSLCGSNDGSQCERIWNHSLLLFDDSNRNRLIDEGEMVWTYQLNVRNSEIQTRLGFGQYVVRLDSRGQANFTGSFLVCQGTASSPLRKVTWNRTGRPYSLKSAEQVAGHSPMMCL